MEKRGIWGIFGSRSKPDTTAEERPPSDDLDLHQWLPQEFSATLAHWLEPDEEPVAVLFVPSERILQWRPGRALIVLNDGVLILEEGESVVLNQQWGVKGIWIPFQQIAAVGLGHALLRGRFVIHAAGSPAVEILLPWHNLNNFRAALRLIRQGIARASKGSAGNAATDLV